MRCGCFNEADMMFAMAGGLISGLLEPGISADRIKLVSTAIMRVTGLRWQRVLINIALAADHGAAIN